MLKRLALAVAVGAALLGTAAPAIAQAAVQSPSPKITCGRFSTTAGGGDYYLIEYGNCADHSVNVHVTTRIYPQDGGAPTVTDSDFCVASQTEAVVGYSAVYIHTEFDVSVTGSC